MANNAIMLRPILNFNFILYDVVAVNILAKAIIASTNLLIMQKVSH